MNKKGLDNLTKFLEDVENYDRQNQELYVFDFDGTLVLWTGSEKQKFGIVDQTKLKPTPLFEKFIKLNEENKNIKILTSRKNKTKEGILKYLSLHGVERFDIKNIITTGDKVEDPSDMAKLKFAELKSLSSQFKQIYYFDDDVRNINSANNISNIKAELVEYKENNR